MTRIQRIQQQGQQPPLPPGALTQRPPWHWAAEGSRFKGPHRRYKKINMRSPQLNGALEAGASAVARSGLLLAFVWDCRPKDRARKGENSFAPPRHD